MARLRAAWAAERLRWAAELEAAMRQDHEGSFRLESSAKRARTEELPAAGEDVPMGGGAAGAIVTGSMPGAASSSSGGPPPPAAAAASWAGPGASGLPPPPPPASAQGDQDMGAVWRDMDQLVVELNALEVAGVDVSELYNPCRFSEVAGAFDLIPGAAFDLRTGWNLSTVAGRTECLLAQAT